MDGQNAIRLPRTGWYRQPNLRQTPSFKLSVYLKDGVGDGSPRVNTQEVEVGYQLVRML